jgi:enoyl-CoA hydratase/carnithine racemase
MAQVHGEPVESKLVLFDLVDGIAILTLNHPEKRNTLSSAVLATLQVHLERIKDDPRVRVVILRAKGPVFSSGHDLRELTDGDEESYSYIFAQCTQVMETIRLLPQPVIAQVQGLATAAGCQLVATCDLAIASETAAFATPGVKIGLFCTTPGVALSRAVSPKRAMEMLLTGAPITAKEALEYGLVNRVVAPAKLEQEVMALARRICVASPTALFVGKRAFYRQLELDRPAAYQLAQRVMVENLLEPDAQERIAAFLDKRPPKGAN